MRLLVLCSRPTTPARRAALAGLAGDGWDLSVQEGVGQPPTVAGFDAVLVDGAPGTPPDDIASWVAAGRSLVAVGAPSDPTGSWARLLGVVAGEPAPAGEYFGRITEEGSAITARLDPEFAVHDAFTPLELLPGNDGRAVVAVSLAFRERAAVVEQRFGAGRLVTSGLGRTDAALGCPELAALLRRSLRAAGSRAGVERTLGLAVAGYGPFGGMGYYHGLAASSVPGLGFVAVADPSAERRKAAEADFPGVRAYSSATELVDDDAVDIVVIATPPASHTPLALDLLRAGKHVACEKPMCLTTADADRLVATADAERRVLTVNQNRRWDPDFVAVRRAVETGMLGQVFNIETFVGGFEHPCRAWHSEVSISGGAVYDWGSHHVDWILQLLGSPPVRVQCQGHKLVWHDVTNLDQLRLRMAWADGREAEFFQSDVAAIKKPKFYVQGTRGTLAGHYRPLRFERLELGRGYVEEIAHHAEAPAALTLARYETGWGTTTTDLPVAAERRFAFHRNLADHLHLGEPLAVSAPSVREVVRVLEAAQRSSDDGGREVRLA